MKKHKLNSKNPKYFKSVDKGPEVEKRVEYKTANGHRIYAVFLK